MVIKKLNKKEDIDFEKDTIKLKEAYKSFADYDDDYNVIGRDKRLDKLKTDDSYRTVPLHPRLKQILLQHREEQKERYRKSIKMNRKKRYWNNKRYVFISRTYTPYLASSLAKPMREFCKKYNLPKVVPYSLRTSFATNNAERGVSKIALKSAMGHSKDSNTLDKFYIQPDEEYIRKEFNKIYKET